MNEGATGSCLFHPVASIDGSVIEYWSGGFTGGKAGIRRCGRLILQTAENVGEDFAQRREDPFVVNVPLGVGLAACGRLSNLNVADGFLVDASPLDDVILWVQLLEMEDVQLDLHISAFNLK